MSNLKYYDPQTLKKGNETYTSQVIIYGATSAGITSAIQLKRYGIECMIVEPTNHVGGMTTSGLSATDLGSEYAVGGISKEFYTKISEHYQKQNEYNFEPKVAKEIYKQWIDEYNIPIYTKQPLKKVIKENNKIKEFTTENGNTFIADVFIDTTYEGDLFAKAGISYKVGREANSQYKEIYNGIQFKDQHHKFEEWIDPYVIEGDPESGLLPGIQDLSMEEIGYPGLADDTIQAYNFRITLTKNKENKIRFPKPKNYNSERYLLLLRYILTGNWDAMNLNTPLPNEKWDLNNYGAFSTDHIGMNYEWPDADNETREKIYQDHIEYNQGILYFLANDSRVPKDIRDEVSEFGLPKDEYEDSEHWPPQLYIREARRMISDYVMTDRNCLKVDTVHDSIGLASYHMDSHNCRRFVIDGRVMNEGDVEIPVSPFPISYRSIRPKKEEATNLLVPVCLSSSHIAYGSIRMEPIFMILGQSAAVAAKIALEEQIPVQDLDYDVLREELIKQNQVVEWDESIEDDPLARMKETFGKE
ncbi:FAD-dependent oxidoreductase [Marinilactibacillus psychrotolerans]|uniref:FAD-dependent oxidoreductase n=1 Tax=Marinilactibacillus psychrotolerans TaxID=191770 RepID=A0A5R9C750_9LACT|nr:FAD-dependent oxidoreductase [Marinilactibacillus psychrotolerans]TLQ08997.1 FAD-dependent oxidoreductase [Marinilactibacillus psychrotolerans]